MGNTPSFDYDNREPAVLQRTRDSRSYSTGTALNRDEESGEAESSRARTHSSSSGLYRKHVHRKGLPVPPETDKFFNDMEEAIRARQASSCSAKSEEPHQWTNFVGGSLNSSSRTHKPHHLFTSTPNLKPDVLTEHIRRKGLTRPARLPIQRRNSTSSVELCLTMDDLDEQGMIRVTALVLHHHIEDGCRKRWPIAAQFRIFDDAAMNLPTTATASSPRTRALSCPTYEEVREFYQYVYKMAQMEKDCIIISLVYIERVLMETCTALRICESNWRSVILSGMILASKVWDDLSMWNSDCAKIAGLTLRRINELEVAVLHTLQYSVRVNGSQFARYYFRLRQWCMLLGEETPGIYDDNPPRRRKHSRDSLLAIGGGGALAHSRSKRCASGLKRKATESYRSPFSTLPPSLEELVDTQLRDAGGRRFSPLKADLKRHEVEASLGRSFRRSLNRHRRGAVLNLILSEVGDPRARYNVQSGPILGVGISGVVQVVRHKQTGVSYAMKTLQLERLEDFVKMDELRNEIEIMASLNHPNIVRLIELYENPSRTSFSFIMDLCTGGELLEKLNAVGHYSEPQAAELMTKMLSAVKHCHESGICHRDLKLENWVFESEAPGAELKLIDFGLSRFFSKEEIMHIPVGTPYSIAPEVLAGHYTSSCDLWSLGVLAYMLLTGYPPFTGQDDFETLAAVKRAQWVWPPHISLSNSAQDFVSRLMLLNPTERMTAEEALQHPWLRTRSLPKSPHSPSPKVLEGLKHFQQMSLLKKLVMSMVAFSLEPSKIEDLRTQFHLYDTNSNGMLTLSSLRSALEASGVTDNSKELQAVLHDLDVEHAGVIRYNDFLAAGLMSLDPQKVLDEGVLRAVFHKFDHRSKGCITVDDLKEFLIPHLSEDEVRTMFSEAGLEDASMITYPSFVHLCQTELMSSPESSTVPHKPPPAILASLST